MLNSVNLIGRLTKDPELRYTGTGVAVARFSLAVDREYSKEKRNQAVGKNQPTADFIRCIAWNKTAEVISNYLTKGQQLAVEGRIQTGSYESNGRIIYTTDVVVYQVHFIGNQSTNNQNYNQGYNNQGYNNQNHNQGSNDGFFPIDDGDIPF